MLQWLTDTVRCIHCLLLCICAVRNFGMGDTKIQMDSKSTKHQKSEFTMRVGKHEATVRFDIFCQLVSFYVAQRCSG